MKKGFYFIGIHDTDKDGKGMFIPKLEEGSVEYHGRLYIHRAKDYGYNPNRWKLSHISSGACILPGLDLASARMLAKKMQPFKIWDIEKFEDIQKACQDSDNPEVKQIISIRFERA